MPKKSGLPKGVTEFKDRHDKWHLRYRAKGKATYYFKTRPGQDGWREELEQAREGAVDAPKVRTSLRTKPGSISALIAVYYGTPEFTGLATSSQKTYRNMLERFRDAHGDKQVATLTRAHIKALIGSMHATPAAANNLLDRLRVLMKIAIDDEWRHDDPTYRVKGFDIEGSGFHTWTDEEIEKFEERHPAGSKPRRALYLLLYTTQRRGDVVGLGKQHRTGDRFDLVQQKTGVSLSLPIHPDLAAELDLAPEGDMLYLTTEHGKPYTSAGFGNWFRRQCDAAGLPQCSAHGLRKAAARRMAEGGKSHAEIKSVTGHVTDKEVTRYTRAADQRRLSDRAIDALSGTKPKHKNG
ncbi:hypothetical protein VW35_01065 [Devosia soli]|uniref:Tyr recombinase domain-containing protein n=1 Tax=Devosia soli TaxID=361041 RepID=A0A0F5LEW1_9HYPH|nr:tyrosine-type recombinase/integrase [Devosia soli]KKB80830.1 hypothetical protein VW35_01065 [Devosia soli]